LENASQFGAGDLNWTQPAGTTSMVQADSSAMMPGVSFKVTIRTMDDEIAYDTKAKKGEYDSQYRAFSVYTSYYARDLLWVYTSDDEQMSIESKENSGLIFNFMGLRHFLRSSYMKVRDQLKHDANVLKRYLTFKYLFYFGYISVSGRVLCEFETVDIEKTLKFSSTLLEQRDASGNGRIYKRKELVDKVDLKWSLDHPQTVRKLFHCVGAMADGNGNMEPSVWAGTQESPSFKKRKVVVPDQAVIMQGQNITRLPLADGKYWNGGVITCYYTIKQQEIEGSDDCGYVVPSIRCGRVLGSYVPSNGAFPDGQMAKTAQERSLAFFKATAVATLFDKRFAAGATAKDVFDQLLDFHTNSPEVINGDHLEYPHGAPLAMQKIGMVISDSDLHNGPVDYTYKARLSVDPRDTITTALQDGSEEAVKQYRDRSRDVLMNMHCIG